MRTRQLESFVRVCELGSITKAARALNIAQPALGIQIRSLEYEFGAQLLERTVSGTRPTAAGLTFLTEAKYLLRRVSDLKRALREAGNNVPLSLTLGVTPSMSGILVPRLLEALAISMPRLVLTIVEELSHVLIGRAAAGGLDLALIYNAPSTSGLTCNPQLREALYFLASPNSPAGQAGPIRLDELAAIELTMPSSGDVLRHLVEDEMRVVGLSPRITYPLDSMQAMKAVIARGLACGVLPACAVSSEIAAGTLIAREIVEPSLWRTLYLVQAKETTGNLIAAGVAQGVRRVLRQLCDENDAFVLV